MGIDLLQISPTDTVGIAVNPLKKDQTVTYEHEQLFIQDDIPLGHKVALVDMGSGEIVSKYGSPIGQTTQPISQGQWVHTHNLKTLLSEKITYTYEPTDVKPFPSGTNQSLPETFAGYIRANGDVGIRNELWILNTVGCVNKTAEQLARMADRELRGNGIDGVYHFAHPYGCSQLGDDLEYTRSILVGLARHPNAAGVLIIGLGCENNQINSFRELLMVEDPNRFRFLPIQLVADEFTEGMKLLRQLASYAKTFQRTRVPVTELRIGLKCGGSDGFSGVTANPLLGAVSDLLVQRRATSLLTEVPEMFGAETILMSRAKNHEVFADIVALINDFKDYYTKHGQVIYENPSPGNKDGGITTLEEKSLGCIQKGGNSLIEGVLPYGQKVQGRGLYLVQSPGNDMVSVTALVGAGAHLILFTTGRGTPMGGAVPTVKISSNTELYRRKPGWIDFNAGSLLDDQCLDDLSMDLYRYLLRIASGEDLVNNEMNGFREIAIFKDGVTL